MGGDEGVNLVIPGAARALIRRPDLRFRLYGDRNAVEPVLARYPRVAEVSVFEHCDYAVRMEEKPSQALRHGRRRSSMWRAIEAVKKGEADFAVSAGNTGALMAMARVRPADARPESTGRRSPRCGRRCAGKAWCSTVGATIGADAQQLVDFAVMGAAMARALFDIDAADRRPPQYRRRGSEGPRAGPGSRPAARGGQPPRSRVLRLRRRRRHRQGHGRCGGDRGLLPATSRSRPRRAPPSRSRGICARR